MEMSRFTIGKVFLLFFSSLYWDVDSESDEKDTREVIGNDTFVIENDTSLVGHEIQSIREGKDSDENESETIPPGHIVRGITFSILSDGLVLDAAVTRDQLRSIIKSKKMKASEMTKVGLIPAILSKTLPYWTNK